MPADGRYLRGTGGYRQQRRACRSADVGLHLFPLCNRGDLLGDYPDVVHKSRVGGASGFIHLIGSVSGIVGPIVTGYIVQSTGKFDSAFVLAGTIAALGALLVLFVIKTPRVTMKASQA